MINILCFGDSNTWGADAQTDGRFDENHRWTRLLAKELGENYTVIEDGLCGRTTVFDDCFSEMLRGKDTLAVALATHQPLDLVVLMLGTNDLKEMFHTSAVESAMGMETLIKIIQNPNLFRVCPIPRILVISPILIDPCVEHSKFREIFGGLKGVERSKHLANEMKKIADLYHCDFMDAAQYAKASEADGIHICAEGHRALSKAVSEKIHQMGL